MGTSSCTCWTGFLTWILRSKRWIGWHQKALYKTAVWVTASQKALRTSVFGRLVCACWENGKPESSDDTKADEDGNVGAGLLSKLLHPHPASCLMFRCETSSRSASSTLCSTSLCLFKAVECMHKNHLFHFLCTTRVWLGWSGTKKMGLGAFWTPDDALTLREHPCCLGLGVQLLYRRLGLGLLCAMLWS